MLRSIRRNSQLGEIELGEEREGASVRIVIYIVLVRFDQDVFHVIDLFSSRFVYSRIARSPGGVVD